MRPMKIPSRRDPRQTRKDIVSFGGPRLTNQDKGRDIRSVGPKRTQPSRTKNMVETPGRKTTPIKSPAKPTTSPIITGNPLQNRQGNATPSNPTRSVSLKEEQPLVDPVVHEAEIIDPLATPEVEQLPRSSSENMAIVKKVVIGFAVTTALGFIVNKIRK